MQHPDEKVILKSNQKAEIRETLDDIQTLMNEISQSKLTIAGKEYDLSKWVTLTTYAKKHNISVSRVHQWVLRGIISSNFLIVVPELNYLKLIKSALQKRGQINKNAFQALLKRHFSR